MSTYRFDQLFNPKSVAIAGASPRETSLGNIIHKNLKAGGFGGMISLLNPRYSEIGGERCYARVSDMHAPPDVLIVAAPPLVIPDMLAEAGKAGVASAVILTAGLGHGPGSLSETIGKEARKTGLRIIGPNCLGMLAPHAGFNASFAARMPLAGDLALVSQSGAVVSGVIEWAHTRQVGLSGVVSLGDMLDVDFGDCLDYFAEDRKTRAILLYVEAIRDARKFMSAARAAARVKPVIVIKSGRHAAAAKVAATHTGALAGTDAVYDAAFRRAGLLRVFDLDELFSAAEMLGRQSPFDGNRLAILTNGGGLGVLAVDRLADLGGTLASLSTETIATLDTRLPPIWSRANPVDIIGDATPERYSQALEAVMADKDVDAVLVMNCPTAISSAAKGAEAVVATVQRDRGATGKTKPVFSVWLGAEVSTTQMFEGARIPSFSTEAEAINGFMQLVRYRQVQNELMQTPEALPKGDKANRLKARAILLTALKEGLSWLNPIDVADLLGSYGIAVTPTKLATTPEEAAAIAADFLKDGAAACVVKILSRDIVHKSDVGGVRLNLATPEQVADAAREIMAAAKRLRADARVEGVTVQPMIRKAHARELIAGMVDDPVFGPVIAFGTGGTAVEIINDKALALPPLDLRLAHDLIGRTRVSRLLDAYRDVPAANRDAVALVLVRLAQLTEDNPEITGIDLNPLLVDATGAIALDARVAIAMPPKGIPASGITSALQEPHGQSRFAIRPYPAQWERSLSLKNGMKLRFRPVRAEDEPLFRAFFPKLEAEDLRLRFFMAVKAPGQAFVARLTQLDYARSMAFLALDDATGELLGVVRLHGDANHRFAEFAVIVRSDLKGQGLGWELMQLILEYAKAEGYAEVNAEVLAENTTMLEMCMSLGFSIADSGDSPGIRKVRLAIAV